MDQPMKPHIAKPLKRLEAVSSELEEKYKDNPWILKRVAKSKRYTEAYIRAYEEGKLFFGREALADISEQIDKLASGQSHDADGQVKFVDVIGRVKYESLNQSFGDGQYKYGIMYCDYQSLTHVSSKLVDRFLNLDTPISLCHASILQPPSRSLCELKDAFRTQQKTWLQSSVCKSLIQLLESARMHVPIHKIVCFGLGSLDPPDNTRHVDLLSEIRRSATQHAAALTMAKVLGARRADGQSLPCYTQDPVYQEIEKGMLASMGMMVVEDPKGFLEIDDNTLVFSVRPNIPVRQIVADVHWPAAMVWDEVLPEKPDEWDRDFEYREFCGERHHVSPWSTDEPSSRVREMVEHYNHFLFPRDEDDDRFGKLGIYLKK